MGRSPNGSTDSRRSPGHSPACPGARRCRPPGSGRKSPSSSRRRTPASWPARSRTRAMRWMTIRRGCALDRFAAARQLVQPLAFELQGRVHRRHLLLFAQERRQRRVDRTIVQRRYGGALDDFGLAVARLGARAELDEHAIGLAGVQQPAADLGRLPEADRQQPGRKRIEAARVTGLGGAEQRANLLESCVGGNAERFVEQQNAVRRRDRSDRVWTRSASSPSSSSSTCRAASSLTALLISADSRAPLSISSSCTNRSSGLWRMPSARPSGPRSSGPAASRISCACCGSAPSTEKNTFA